jgi:hypothetical protein
MRKILFFIIVGVGVILTATSVPAATFTYPLDIEFSGATEPEGLTPWLTATFEDVATNQVQLTMSASGLTDAEFVSEWYFNFDPAFNPGDRITFPLIISGPPYLPGTGIGANNFQADGESEKFDIVFQFEIANNPNRFTMGESAVYLFTGTGGPDLTADSFNFLNEDGTFYSAAHVQGIGESNNLSGWIAATESISAIPEPGTILLLGAGLAGLFGIRRFKFKKN